MEPTRKVRDMKLLDFLTLIFALAFALNVALSHLYGINLPFWRYLAYDDFYLIFLIFCCVFQFARGVTRLADA